jgi:excisionase family DNA binding protein
MALMTAAKAAIKLGISHSHLRKLMRDGLIKAKKPGHDWLIDERSLKGFERRRQPKK